MATDDVIETPDGEPVEPWDIQDGETAHAFGAFVQFRDLGPSRTLGKVAKVRGRSKRLMENWSRQHRWVERATAWDVAQDRVRRAAHMESAREQTLAMNAEQARLGQALRTLASARAEAMRKRLESDPESVAELSWGEVARLAEVGAKIERVALGEVTERMEFSGAREFVAGFLRIAIKYVPAAQQRAFLTEMEVSAGLSTLIGEGEDGDG